MSHLTIVLHMCLQDCNDFLAGNMLQSATRFRALDETALFGSTCRHEFPAVFLNLKHGEKYIIPHRISYAVCLIDDLIKRHEHTEVYIMYNVACTLQKHLKVSKGHNLIAYLSNNTLATHLCLEKHSAEILQDCNSHFYCV